MVFPLIPLALGSMAVSGGANLYKAYRQRQLYNQFEKGYGNLYKGYNRYLASQGRRINPNRALTSYYGNQLRAGTSSDVALASGIGSGFGTFGAGMMLGGRTKKWF